jgi:hypothetical protein
MKELKTDRNFNNYVLKMEFNGVDKYEKITSTLKIPHG